ncbi:ribosomal protection-like ABC-F family protein [Alkalihalobacillus sp. 1P02AB]|uniref:ribosomal protection-like ABC-F family protein n=1 Tax=Alkalihalobacillus sp. 1P02AB TaxID=3132260 RepID=UPI0039A58C7F
MLFLEIGHLEKSYGERLLLEIELLQVYKGDKIGVVGKNGEGKSSLLKIIVGELEPDKGAVQMDHAFAYIPQLEAVPELESEVFQKEKIRWSVPNNPSETLSGGEITRKKIAEAFAKEPNVLIADEPTSHLDMQGIEELENHFKKFKGALIIISHDRQLLNTICTKIWEIADGKVRVFEGNYEAHLEQKEQQKERKQFEYIEYEKEKRRLEDAAKAQSQKSKSLKKAPSRMGNSEARLHKRSVGKKKAKLDRGVKAIQTRLEQLEKKEKPKVEEPLQFDLSSVSFVHSKNVIQFDEVEGKAGDRLLFNRLNGTIKPGAKVAIIGGNGSGKSTLLKMIFARENGIQLSKVAELAFFYQKLEHLNPNQTILENVQETSDYPESFIRTVLARLLFKRDDVHKKVYMLSGGERVKTSLAKVFLSKANVLLLDEPTNYLDLPTKEALAEVLKAYPGTILFVSHDRYFINELASDKLTIDNGIAQLESRNKQTHSIMNQSTEDKLRLELEITETLSKLSVVLNEDEKAKLEQRFQQLLRQKKEWG